MKVYSIGFTQKSAREFFGTLKEAGITRLVDVRLNNISQLSGFSKRADLEYFLRELCNADYVHQPLLAPTQGMLDEYKKLSQWDSYAPKFVALLKSRQIEKHISPDLFSGKTVLLCSEPEATHCHRRLVAEYLRDHWDNVEIEHL